MNTSKFVKVFEALVGSGLSSKEATKIALKVSSKSEGVIGTATKATKGDGGSLKTRILAFANNRKGHEWSLAQCAMNLGADPNNVSAQITPLYKDGSLVRIGRGKYRTSNKA